MSEEELRDPAVYSWSEGRGLDVIEHKNGRRLADYWNGLRVRDGRVRPMPRRQDLDPLELRWALSRLFLMDREPGTDIYRYRLAGDDIETAFIHATGRNSVKGATMEDLLVPDSAAVVRERWRPLTEHGHIIYMTGEVYHAAGRVGVGIRVMLPLSDSGDETVTGILGFTDWTWQTVPPAEDESREGRLHVTYIPRAELD
jgi:hypothetical protein